MAMKFQINKPVFVVKEKVKGIVKGFKDGKVIVTYFPRNSSNRQVEQLDPTELRPYRQKKRFVRKNRRTKRYPLTIKIKYFDENMPKLEKSEKGDWIDFRAMERVELKAGEFKLIPLGVAVELPKGYELNIVPRSSTFKNYGIIQTNSFGVIDSSYCGDNDMIMMPVYATRDTVIEKYDRICQGRINRVMPPIRFQIVDKLDNPNRSGFGSTGVQ